MNGHSDDKVSDYMVHYANFKTLKSRKEIDLLNEIKLTFGLVKNPWMFLLHCFKYNNEVYEMKGKSLCSAIVEGFNLYAKENKHNLPDISIDLQMDAYAIAKESKQVAIKSLLKIFNFQNRKDIILPYLKEEIKQGNYSFVCIASICMNLQNEFSPFELLIPLYFLSLFNILKELISSSDSQGKSLLKELDKYIGRDYNFSDIQELVPCNVNMKSKTITEVMKFSLAVIKDFNIDPQICPNILYNHSLKTVFYLFKKYFSLKEITIFAFCLFLRDYVRKIPALEAEVLSLIDEYDDKEVLDLFLKVKRCDNDTPLEDSNDRDIDDSDRYHQLAIDKSFIHYVTTLEDFECKITKILSYPVIGIDCEWHPTTIIGSQEILTLIQVAVEDAVYIFDMYELSKIFTPDHWEQLGTIFSSCTVKLTYGFKSDSMILSRINKILKSHIKMMTGHIDFDNIKGTLLMYYPSLFPHNNSNLLKGLSELVYLCFGLPLNKIYQYSYWIHRPLSFNEIHYAAIDAHCLIEIKNYLDGICSEMGIEDWTKLNNVKAVVPKKSHKVPSLNVKPTYVHEVKFVCDTMVQGLGRLLRHCGIDTKVLDRCDDHDKCVSIHEKEGRIVLTRGSVYNRLTKFIPENYVHQLTADTAHLQLEEVVKCFNIKVTEMDVFGRCAECNSGRYLSISKEVMVRMRSKSESTCNDWTIVDGGEVNCRRRITGDMVAIKVDDVPLGVINNYMHFYVCSCCGKCYWDGSHHEKVLKNMLKSVVM